MASAVMNYSDLLIDHYENPRNVGALDRADPAVGTGVVGTPSGSEVIRLQLRVGEGGRIEQARFMTHGGPAAIACSSLLTEWLKGLTPDEALEIRSARIAQALELPAPRIHCSILAEEAVRAAIDDYLGKHGGAKAARAVAAAGTAASRRSAAAS